MLTQGRADLFAGLKQGLLIGLAVSALTLPPAGQTTTGRAHPRVPAEAAALGGRSAPAVIHNTPRMAEFGAERAGTDARTIADCAKVLDALKDPVTGYYDPRDPYTTVPRSSVCPVMATETPGFASRMGTFASSTARASSRSTSWS